MKSVTYLLSSTLRRACLTDPTRLKFSDALFPEINMNVFLNKKIPAFWTFREEGEKDYKIQMSTQL